LFNNFKPKAYNIRIINNVSINQNIFRFPLKAEKIYNITYNILKQIYQPINIIRVELNNSLKTKIDIKEKAFYLIFNSFVKYIR